MEAGALQAPSALCTARPRAAKGGMGPKVCVRGAEGRVQEKRPGLGHWPMLFGLRIKPPLPEWGARENMVANQLEKAVSCRHLAWEKTAQTEELSSSQRKWEDGKRRTDE